MAFAQMLMAFEQYAPQCLRKAAITIPSGALHDLPMATAAATGRQIMIGIKALRLCSAFAAHVAKCGLEAYDVRQSRNKASRHGMLLPGYKITLPFPTKI